ncbi:MAG: hypothetical protein C4576_19680 [Desulfobacteraceae bacterium]|nr:MAG: hypothetical protein C4576_19680 [Desulfobacteraceae bacterium]
MYSFKNLLEFAFAHKANNLGLSLMSTRNMLAFLERRPELINTGLFDPEKKVSIKLHYADIGGKQFFKLSGDSLDAQTKRTFYPTVGFERLIGVSTETLNRDPKGLQREIHETLSVSKISLDDLDGHVTVNLGSIKDRVLQAIG